MGYYECGCEYGTCSHRGEIPPVPPSNLDFTTGSPYLDQLLQSRVDMEFALPPVGITPTRVQLGGQVYEQFTVRCDREGCWFVVTRATSEDLAQQFLDNHKLGSKHPIDRGWPSCPTPPLRESLPSGHKMIDRLWHEVDDVVEALFTDTPYRDMSGDLLKGYAKGIAFSIVMLDTALFPHLDAVSKEGRRRRQMRLGQIPYSKTPSRFHGDSTITTSSEFVPSPLPPKPVSKPKPATRNLPPEAPASIRAAREVNMFSDEDLAKMWGITVEDVQRIAASGA